MKVLITGGNGFLGRIIKQIIINDCEIFTLGRNDSNYCVDLSLNHIEFIEKFNVVIHCAGMAHVTPQTENETRSFFCINVNGTKNLLKSLENLKPNKFVFISSVSVYGIISGENISETAPLLANDPYGKSKIEAEEIVIKWCDKHNVICTILRLPLIVGPNPPGNLGAMIRGIKNRYYFNIAGGTAKKSIVLATDIARFILNAAEKGGTYNLTDGYHPTFKELSKSIANKIGKPFVPNLPKFIALILSKFGDLIGNNFPVNSQKFLKITSTLTFDDTKAREAFGWDPSPVLESFKIEKDAK